MIVSLKNYDVRKFKICKIIRSSSNCFNLPKLLTAYYKDQASVDKRVNGPYCSLWPNDLTLEIL